MKKSLFPAEGFGWAWLNQNPVQRDYTAEVTVGSVMLATVAALLAVGAIAYDQARDARWDAERQAICDRQGC